MGMAGKLEQIAPQGKTARIHPQKVSHRGMADTLLDLESEIRSSS
jgi:hypothetical protein